MDIEAPLQQSLMACTNYICSSTSLVHCKFLFTVKYWLVAASYCNTDKAHTKSNLPGIDLCFMDQCMPIYLHATPMFYWVCYVVAVCALHVPPVVQFGMSARGSHLCVLCHMFKLRQAIKPLFDSQSKDRDDPWNATKIKQPRASEGSDQSIKTLIPVTSTLTGDI